MEAEVFFSPSLLDRFATALELRLTLEIKLTKLGDRQEGIPSRSREDA